MNIGECYSEKIVATDEIIAKIADVSGDVNPIHLDDDYAKQSVFGKRIAHGLFCINAISRIIGNYLPGAGAILIEQKFKYRKPVYINDEIEITVKVIDKIIEKSLYTLEAICINQNNDVVLEGISKIKWKENN